VLFPQSRIQHLPEVWAVTLGEPTDFGLLGIATNHSHIAPFAQRQRTTRATT